MGRIRFGMAIKKGGLYGSVNVDVVVVDDVVVVVAVAVAGNMMTIHRNWL